MPRPLTPTETAALLALDVPLHLASVDAQGYPHVTPLWFEWDGAAFWMTSLATKPHVRRLRGNAAASVCIDIEDDERPDGQRPNRQVRAIGRAELIGDIDGTITRRITSKYIQGPARARVIEARTAAPRVAIRLEPTGLVAIASI